MASLSTTDTKKQDKRFRSDSDVVALAEPVANPLRDYIIESARTIHRTEMTMALLRWMLSIVVVFFSMVLIDQWLWPLSTSARYVVWVAFIGGTGVWFATMVLPLIGRTIHPHYAARQIETTLPEMKEGLITWVQLSESDTPPPKSVLNAVGRYVAMQLKGQDIASVIDQLNPLKLAAALMGLTLIGAIYLATSPKNVPATIQRLLMPWANVAPATRVQIVSVSPGDTAVIQGSTAPIAIQVRGWQRQDKAVLRYSTDDGQTVDQLVTMVSDIEGLSYRVELGKTFGGILQPMHYSIEAGDAVAGPFAIQVQAIPLSILEKVEYVYPEYTRLSPRTIESDGRIEGPEGTLVRITAKGNQPMKSARVEFDSTLAKDGSYQPEWIRDLNVDQRFITGEWILEVNEKRSNPSRYQYRIRSTNTLGESAPEPVIYPMTVVADLAPEVDFAAEIKDSIEVAENSSIEIEVRATDPDFGLMTLVLDGTPSGIKNGKPSWQEVLLDDAQGVTGQSVHTISISPKDLRYQAGDKIDLVLTVSDNRHDPQTKKLASNIVKSRVVSLKVTPPGKNTSANTPENKSENTPASGQPNKDASNDSSQDKTTNQPSKNNAADPVKKNPDKPGTEKANNKKPNGADEKTPADRENREQKNPGQKNEGPKNSPDKNDLQKDAQEKGSNGNDPQQKNRQENGQKNGSKQTQRKNELTQDSKRPQQPKDQQSKDQNSKDQNSKDQNSKNDRQKSQNQKGSEQTQPNQEKKNQPNGQEQGADEDQSGGSESSAAGQQGSQKSAGGQPGGKSSDAADGQSSDNGEGGDDSDKGTDSQGMQNDSSKSPPSKSPGSKPQKSYSGDSEKSGDDGADSGSDQAMDASDSDASDKDAADGQTPTHDGEAFERLQKILNPSNSRQASNGKSQDDANASDEQSPPTDNAQGQEAENASSTNGSSSKSNATNKNSNKQSDGQSSSGNKTNHQPDSTNSNQNGSPKADSQVSKQSNPNANPQSNPKAGQDSSTSDSQASDSTNKQPGENGSSPKGAKPGESSSSKGDQGEASAGESASGDSKTADIKTGEGKSGEGKSGEGKSGEGKSGEGKSGEGKTGNSKSGSAKSGDSTSSEASAGEASSSGASAGEASSSGADSKSTSSQGSGSKNSKSGDSKSGGAAAGGSQGLNSSGNSGTASGDSGGNGTSGTEGQGHPETDSTEYAKSATDLVLESLKRQREQPDPELLKRMGWSTEQMQSFIDRWQKARDEAITNSSKKKEYEDMLQSLGLVPQIGTSRSVRGRTDGLSGLREEGSRVRPPESLRERFEAFRKASHDAKSK